MNLNTLLWSTRGRDWGFRMLLYPQMPCEDWLVSYQSMFKQSSSDEAQFRRGQVELGQGRNVPYVAVKFTDPQSRTDRAGRLIPHEIAVIGEESKNFKDFNSVKEAVWKILSDTYTKLYELQAREIETIQITCVNGSFIISNKEYQKRPDIKEELSPNFLQAIGILAAVIAIALLAVVLLNPLTQKPEAMPFPNRTVPIDSRPIKKVLELT